MLANFLVVFLKHCLYHPYSVSVQQIRIGLLTQTATLPCIGLNSLGDVIQQLFVWLWTGHSLILVYLAGSEPRKINRFHEWYT